MNVNTPANLKARALTDDELRIMAPSIFTDTAAPNTSARYAHVSSAAVLASMRNAGFMPVRAQQAKARSADGADFARHIIRFRHSDAGAIAVNDTVPEIALMNAHDKTSAYRLLAGLFRLVCANGMIVAEGTVAAVHINHVGKNIEQKVIDGSFAVLEGANRALEAPRLWSTIPMTAVVRDTFANEALALRFPDEDKQPISPRALLNPRRAEDNGTDLWRTFNVVQENLLKGGLRGVSTTGSGRRVRTRAVGRISEDVRINGALWALAEGYAKVA